MTLAMTTLARRAMARATTAIAIEPPRGYGAPVFASNGSTANRFEGNARAGSTSPRAYAMDWPSGWCALEDLESARLVNVDASFKDPEDEASTLAVFVTPVREKSVDARFGTLREDARGDGRRARRDSGRWTRGSGRRSRRVGGRSMRT